MAKGNMLLGHARGKVGSLVFSRSAGQQVVRARAEVVKNPKTQAQMVQRIILNTISQAYSRMVEIVDHSFEGVAPGLASMAYFNSKNMDALRNKIKDGIAAGQSYYDIVAFSPLNSATFCPNDFLISKGSLPEIVAEYVLGNKAGISGIAENTYQAIIDAYGLQRGDQLTFITLNGSYALGTEFHFARVILDPLNADLTPADLSTPFIANGAINKPNGRNEGEFTSLEFSGGQVQFAMTQKVLNGCAVIVSRKNADGVWLRSRATINAYDDNIVGFYPSLQECLDALEDNGLAVLNQRYLNNAGRGRLETQTPSLPDTEIASMSVGTTELVAGQTTALASNGQLSVSGTLTTAGAQKVGIFTNGSSPSLVADITITGTTLSGSGNFQRNTTYAVRYYTGPSDAPVVGTEWAKFTTSEF